MQSLRTFVNTRSKRRIPNSFVPQGLFFPRTLWYTIRLKPLCFPFSYSLFIQKNSISLLYPPAPPLFLNFKMQLKGMMSLIFLLLNQGWLKTANVFKGWKWKEKKKRSDKACDLPCFLKNRKQRKTREHSQLMSSWPK